MTLDFAQSPNRIPWPPLLTFGAVLGALALDALWPLSLPGFRLWMPLGLVLMAAGAGLDLLAMLTMWRHRANILPHRAATLLISWGPFALTRNPIYLGNTILLVGAGLTFGNFWFLPLALIAAALVSVLAIRREERHLAALFGKAWSDYAGRTRRWL